MKKQHWADRILFGLDDASLSEWHIAEYAVDGWKKIGPKLSRAGVRYARIRYDDTLLVIADSPIPDSEPMPVAKAWDRVVERLEAFRPDRYLKDSRIPLETHKRNVSVSDQWPEAEDQKKAIVKFAFVGIVKKDLDEIQVILDRHEVESEIWKWESLPPNFQWAISWYVRADMEAADVIQLWREMGLRIKPRKGESEDGMCACLFPFQRAKAGWRKTA